MVLETDLVRRSLTLKRVDAITRENGDTCPIKCCDSKILGYAYIFVDRNKAFHLILFIPSLDQRLELK